MTPYYTDDAVTLWHGDCLDVLATLRDASVDAVVTDPPYGLEFMGKEWDAPWRYGFGETGYTDGKRMARPNFGSSRNPVCRVCRKHQRGTKRCQCETPDFDERPADSSRLFGAWCELWAAECLRVLQPGGHMLAFGGTRTWHRLACAVEDAGFEVRDSIAWLYGSGFPKSLDVSKAIDKTAGAERDVLGLAGRSGGGRVAMDAGTRSGDLAGDYYFTAPATDAARQWQGWGTALKPAFEPIVVARKPLTGTVASNVLAYGTGALHIDACRVGTDARPVMVRTSTVVAARSMSGESTGATASGATTTRGRWPANVVLDDAQAAELDQQSGNVKGAVSNGRRAGNGAMFDPGEQMQTAGYADQGGASRFFPVFRYEPKAPTTERPRGDDGAAHPTVKPLDLIRWLVRLVCPPGGVVLDPFLGSGTTAEACIVEGFRCIGVERDADYLRLAAARLSKPIAPVLFGEGSA